MLTTIVGLQARAGDDDKASAPALDGLSSQKEPSDQNRCPIEFVQTGLLRSLASAQCYFNRRAANPRGTVCVPRGSGRDARIMSAPSSR